MRREAARIDKCSIENATYRAKDHIAWAKAMYIRYTTDPHKESRLKASECIVCYGGSRIGGAACTSRPCCFCGTQVSSGSTNIDAICLECAKANSLCKHCGGDIDLKSRRKPRPYESWPPPPQCEKCKSPCKGDWCLACGHKKECPLEL